MSITITNVPIAFDSRLSPVKIITESEDATQSHFDLSIQAVLGASGSNALMHKQGSYLSTVSIEDVNYDLTQLPAKALAFPVILGYVNKSDFITFNFTTAIPNYDQLEARRPVLTRIRLNAKPDWYSQQNETLVILNNYLLIIDLSTIF